MSNKYLLKYKTFDELVAEVLNSLKVYAENGMIDTSELIGEARRINKSLGNKLAKSKEGIVMIQDGKGRLPKDFRLLNFAFCCFGYTTIGHVISGDQREYRLVDESVVLPEGCDSAECVRLNSCGKAYEIIQTTQYDVRRFTDFKEIRLMPDDCINPMSPNLSTSCYDAAYIQDKFLYTNFCQGSVYMCYLGDMEDDNGNLIVLDHELVNPYYEYALKRKIYENLYLNGEEVAQKLNLIEARYKEARIVAEGLVNSWEISEMKAVHKMNRQAMYEKYYYIFK